MNPKKGVGVVGLILGLCLPVSISAAGGSSPPVVPVATKKLLSEIEPRISINATNTPGDDDSSFKITESGSYYLTGGISGEAGKMGIEVAAQDVTLDLSGFTMTGVPGSLAGISATATLTNVTVCNGSVRDWGGAGLELAWCSASRVQAVAAIDNAGTGIQLGGGAEIMDCVSRGNTTLGFYAGPASTVTDCRAADNGYGGIEVGTESSVSGCTARGNGSLGILINGGGVITGCVASDNGGIGIGAGYGCVFSGCAANNNSYSGFWINIGGTAVDCSARENGEDGFLVWSGTVTKSHASENGRDGIRLEIQGGSAVDNTCQNNGIAEPGAGVRALAAACRLESNHVFGNDIGVVAAADCMVMRNSARGNTSGNYSFPAGAEYGQIITNPGNAFVASNPWANFAY